MTPKRPKRSRRATAAPDAELGALLEGGALDQALARANALLDAAPPASVTLQAHLAHARVALARGDDEVAERALDAARAIAPDDPALRALLAQQALDQGRPETALDHLHALRERGGGELPAMAWHALARLAGAAGDPALALDGLQRALRVQPGSRDLSLLVAAALAQAGQDAEAMDRLQGHCARHPGDLAAWQLGGRLLTRNADPATVLLWWREALAAGHDDDALHLRLLAAAVAAGQARAAQPSVEALRARAAAQPGLHARLASYYLACGKVDLALNSLAALEAAEPAHDELARLHAAALVQKARTKLHDRKAQQALAQARALLEARLSACPDDDAVAVDLSALLLQDKGADPTRAAQLLDAVIKRQPRLPAALLNRAALHLARRETAKARALAQRALDAARPGSEVATQAKALLQALAADGQSA